MYCLEDINENVTRNGNHNTVVNVSGQLQNMLSLLASKRFNNRLKPGFLGNCLYWNFKVSLHVLKQFNGSCTFLEFVYILGVL